MSTITTNNPPKIHYPDSDGMPMADNTLQFEWIVTLKGNLDLIFRDAPDIFVAGDHLIYPIKGDIATRFAPDVYVAFGRPKGYRGSYVVCEEADIFPQVIFEVWSPGNRQQDMEKKRKSYEHFGAEEYYLVYPDSPASVEGWRLENGKFVVIPEMNGFVSPRLQVRFELIRDELFLYRPDGSRFLNYVEQGVVANEERQRAEDERRRAEKLAARLRELGVDPEAV